MFRLLLIILGFCFTLTSHADCSGISRFDQNVIRQIFSLRDAAKLGTLQNDSKLNAVATRVAQANLEREESIEHKDLIGKSLKVRADEEGYFGYTGEIVVVGVLPCEESLVHPSGSQERSMELGEEFKEAIRNSPRHYQGIMARTGVNWDQFGYSLKTKRVYIGESCMQKYSLGLVLGKLN